MGSEYLRKRVCNLNEAEETAMFISEKLQTVDGRLATEAKAFGAVKVLVENVYPAHLQSIKIHIEQKKE